MSTAVVYSAAALVVVLMVLTAVTRWGVFESDDENTGSGTERIQQEAENAKDDYTVSLFKRHKALTLPGKVVVACLCALVVGGALYAYSVLRSGSPVEVPYATAMQQAAIVTTAFVAGVLYTNSRDRGRVQVVYEDSDGSVQETETIYYRPSEATTDSDGTPIVYETHPRRILGLFDRRKLAAHDRELRSERAILHDTVAHEIPNHAVELDRHEYVIRTQGETIPNRADEKAADYRYTPPIQLDYSEYVRNQERVKKMQTKKDSMAAQLAEAEQELRRLKEKLETKDRRVREKFKNDVMEILRTVQQSNRPDVTMKQNRARERQPESQREVDELNSNGADHGGVSS